MNTDNPITSSDPTDATPNHAGAFYESLVRNNGQIRRDRAAAIFEDARLQCRREVEDLELRLKKLRWERESMLDLSPTDADSLVLASDFNARMFVERDLNIAVQLRNLEIKTQLARARYEHLFGPKGTDTWDTDATAPTDTTA